MIIYIESVCGEVGEYGGAFDADGNLLHMWSDNDATWRHEYFDPMMVKLGIEVRRGRFADKLEEEAVRRWG